MKNYEVFTKEKMLYLYKATKPIKYKKLQDRIYFELSNHIDDMFCDFIDNGMSEEDATEKFLNEMGSPEELGEELKKTHKDTLRLVKFIKSTTIFAVFGLIVTIFGVFEAKDNLDFAKQLAFPQETVELKKSLFTYTKLEEYNIFNDICYYTNIDWYDLSTTKPIYKVKENNLFKDYYILDESHSVLVDTFMTPAHGAGGTIYVDDINKLPRNYHSDKLSKVVLSNYDFSFTLSLSPEEILELEKMAISNGSNLENPSEFEELIVFAENDPYYWIFQFHIKDLDGLYYRANNFLYKSVNGKYYIGDWWYGAQHGYMCAEIPEHIAKKIDKSFEEANIKFEDGETYFN